VTDCITNVPRKHKIAVSAGHAYDATTAVTLALPVLQNNHQWIPEFVEDEGNRGNIWRASEGVVYSRGMGTGNVSLIPRGDDINTLFPLIFGGDVAGTPGALCEFFTMRADKNVTTFEHQNCKTQSASFSSSSGSPILSMDWAIESCNYADVGADAIPSALTFSELKPFVHSRATVTIDGDTYQVDDVTISVQNSLGTDLFYNSPVRTDLYQGEQIITFTHSSPFDSAADLDLLVQGQSDTSVSATVQYVTGSGASTSTMTWNFVALHAPVPTPITPGGNTPVRYNGITWRARTIGSGGSLQPPFTMTIT
jgi:hypothetical protein